MPAAILAILAGTGFLAYCAFSVAERCLRSRWRGRSQQMMMHQSPYRAPWVTIRTSDRAPRSVRAAALTSILFGSLAVPSVLWAMAALEPDGITLSLLAPVACAAAVCVAGWLLLARAASAPDVARTAARATIAAHVALLTLAVLHVAAAWLGWSDRPSIAFVVVAFSFGLAALPQAVHLRAVVASLPADFASSGAPPPLPAVETMLAQHQPEARASTVQSRGERS